MIPSILSSVKPGLENMSLEPYSLILDQLLLVSFNSLLIIGSTYNVPIVLYTFRFITPRQKPKRYLGIVMSSSLLPSVR